MSKLPYKRRDRELLPGVDMGGKVLEVDRDRGLNRAAARDCRLRLEHPLDLQAAT